MSLKSLLIISAVIAAVITHNVSRGMANPDENTEVGTGARDYTSTYPVADSQASSQHKAFPMSMSSRSGQSPQECSNYKIFSSADRAQGAIVLGNRMCDSALNPGWYRFSGDAGDKMPTSCVPRLRCGAHAPGWMNGNHPTANESIVQRQVCFHWDSDCCKWKTNIRVRNCGHFYVYELPGSSVCWLRYCGNALGPLNKTLGCGGNLTSLAGQVTSPGYPNYMEPITCHWTIQAPFDGNILLCFENLTLSHEGCSSNIITIDTNGLKESFCANQKNFLCHFGKKNVSIRYQSTDWTMKSGFKLRYMILNGDLDKAGVQSKWNISVKAKGSSTIQVSWQAFSDLDANKYIYGYVVVCKPANQRPVYVLTEPSAATITINGLSGGTEYKVQVVALVNDKNAMSPSLNGSVIAVTFTHKGGCTNYNELSTWDRAQGAPGGGHCDQWSNGNSAWYRFTGQAGTQIATSCVPKNRCGGHASGWMLGTHPAVQDGIITRTICFHHSDNCCIGHNTVKVRNCGEYFVYLIQSAQFCGWRYCGNNGGCGKTFNDTSGTVTSPGYPTRIYWNSKCQWNLTAPSPTGAIVVIVEHLSLPISARCLVFNLTLENGKGFPIGKACGVRRLITWVSEGTAILKFHSSRATSRWVGFRARYFIFSYDLTNIPELLQWPGVSAQPMNSTAITIRWGTYPSPPGNPSVTEYLIICVPDGLPLNATVFTANVSQNSLVVTGLMKYTNYTVQIVVRNSHNDFQYLGSQKFRDTTFEDVPSEGPAISAEAAKGKNAIMVSWQPIPKRARNGIITHYVIYHKKASASDSWIEMNVSTQADGPMPMTEYLTDLEPATEYRIQMAGVTSVGVGAMSKAVLAISGCNYIKNATGNQFSWTFTSPRYPGNYLSKLDCTWWIGSENLDVYVVFDEFHVEEGNPCPDRVVVKKANGITSSYCGKRDPFAVKLSSEAGFVQLKTDGGLEESGFHARVFALTNRGLSVQYDIKPDQNTATITISLGKYKGTVLEYVVLYGKGSSSTDQIWNATITTTDKVVLTGLDDGGEYFAIFLIHTTKGVYRGSRDASIRLLRPSATTGTEEPEATKAPKINEKLGMYPYDESVGDSLVPNTEYYSTHCLLIDIPDSGMQFFKRRHDKIHICRNGLLLFGTPQLIRWPRRFSEQHKLLRNEAILAPYWALTDVEDSFITLGVSKVYYQVYKDTDSSLRSKTILRQASYHVKNNFDTTGVNELVGNFRAKWVLKVTWVDLRYPDTTRLALTLKNTFQAVVMTDGTFSFAMYNYPHNGIQWAAPTERKYYSLYAAKNNYGLPVVGFNSGEHNRDVQRHYDVIGSGTPGIVNINALNGSIVYPINNETIVWTSKTHELPGTWFFRLEDNTGRLNFKQKCIDWYKKEKDHRQFTELLEPCPCTYRQAFWDERFGMDPKERHRICAYTVFESVDGWGQECCYDRSNGALIKGIPDGGTARKLYMRGKRTIKEQEYITCCTYSNMCHLYYKRRPTNDCSGYKQTEWSWLWGDPHFVTLDGLNYTFNGLGEYIMADISNGLFQLQARTQLVEGGGKATVFVAAVAKQTGSSAVQVNLKPGGGLEVLVNGTLINHNILTNTSTLYNGSIALSRPDPTSITVLFPSGISVKMTDVKDSLAIVLAAPERFKNKTRGLLGVWNDDPEDDLTTPTGRVVPINATGRMIHYEFGQTWQVTEDTSLFTYKHGESVHTFSNSSFEPMFIEGFKFANETVRQEALAKCAGDVNCLYDAALTNDVTMGTSTKIVGSRLKNESEALKNSVPLFLNDSSTFFVTLNTTARIEIFANDTDGDPLTFDVSGILPENLTKTDSERSVVISWKVTMDKIKFEFTVMDDKGAVALLRPEVHVCACHNGGYCSPDSNNNVFADSTNDTFVIMPCTCIHGYTGRFCENDLDACQANRNPCYPGVKCTDLPPPQGVSGYKCGPCPSGFTGDGATCLDLDECDKVNQGCSQVCVNTPGSFVCDCNQGYRLSIDQKTCNDIDECFPSSDCMQKCTNTAGSYRCECDDGFKVDPDNPKKCVPKVPCTKGEHGCQHICYTKDGRQQCACHKGYKLLDDQKTCKDIDECEPEIKRCSQYCNNTVGSYKCWCKTGFKLDKDLITCVDVDECMELTYQCADPSLLCLNTDGTYKCVCGEGLYLTKNNTCREIDGPVPPEKPDPPKPPTETETKNSINITVQGLDVEKWYKPLEKKFKDAVAKAVTKYCADKDEFCKKARRRERRALDYILYTADQVHLLPGFPKQIILKSRDLAAVIAFYVEFPPEVVSTSGDSIEGGILVEVVNFNKKDIEKALIKTISSITLYILEQPSKKDQPKTSMTLYIIIGASVGAVVLLVIVGVLVRRYFKKNIVQEKTRRNRPPPGITNQSYDAVGEAFQFRQVSTADSTEYVQLGRDNPDVDYSDVAEVPRVDEKPAMQGEYGKIPAKPGAEGNFAEIAEKPGEDEKNSEVTEKVAGTVEEVAL